MEVHTFNFYWHHHGGEVGSHSLPPDEGASSNSWVASLKSGGWGVQGEVPHHHRMGVEIQALYLASSNTAWAQRVASTSLLPPVKWGSLGPLPQLPNLFSKVRVWNGFFPGILLKGGIYYQNFSVLLGCTFPVFGQQKTGFSWDSVFFHCRFCVVGLLQQPLWHTGGKKKTQRTHRHVIPWILGSLTSPPSLYLSETSYACFTCNVQFSAVRSGKAKGECIYSIY